MIMYDSASDCAPSLLCSLPICGVVCVCTYLLDFTHFASFCVVVCELILKILNDR